MNDLQEILSELANVITRIENVEGHFDNFDTTLNNHMTDYDRKLNTLQRMFSWGFWILFSLCLIAFGGLISIAVVLVQYYLKGG